MTCQWCSAKVFKEEGMCRRCEQLRERHGELTWPTKEELRDERTD